MKIKECQTIREALALCMEQEQASFEQYSKLAKRTLNLHQKSIWEQLSNDELRHKSLLTSLQENHQFLSQHYEFATESIKFDFLKIERPINPIKEIFTNAINAEIEAYNEYFDMAKQASTEPLRNLFQLLGQEELSHKNILEEELKTLE